MAGKNNKTTLETLQGSIVSMERQEQRIYQTVKDLNASSTSVKASNRTNKDHVLAENEAKREAVNQELDTIRAKMVHCLELIGEEEERTRTGDKDGLLVTRIVEAGAYTEPTPPLLGVSLPAENEGQNNASQPNKPGSRFSDSLDRRKE